MKDGAYSHEVGKDRIILSIRGKSTLMMWYPIRGTLGIEQIIAPTEYRVSTDNVLLQNWVFV